MRERKRRHDDVHIPFGGKGKRAWRKGAPWPHQLLPEPPVQTCPWCGLSRLAACRNTDEMQARASDPGCRYGLTEHWGAERVAILLKAKA
jgi:hypothetical protein